MTPFTGPGVGPSRVLPRSCVEGRRETAAWDLALLGKPTYCTLGFKPPGLGAAGGRAVPGRAECPPRGVGQGPESVRSPSLSIPLPLLPPASPATSPPSFLHSPAEGRLWGSSAGRVRGRFLPLPALARGPPGPSLALASHRAQICPVCGPLGRFQQPGMNRRGPRVAPPTSGP